MGEKKGNENNFLTKTCVKGRNVLFSQENVLLVLATRIEESFLRLDKRSQNQEVM